MTKKLKIYNSFTGKILFVESQLTNYCQLLYLLVSMVSSKASSSLIDDGASWLGMDLRLLVRYFFHWMYDLYPCWCGLCQYASSPSYSLKLIHFWFIIYSRQWGSVFAFIPIRRMLTLGTISQNIPKWNLRSIYSYVHSTDSGWSCPLIFVMCMELRGLLLLSAHARNRDILFHWVDYL